MKITVVEQIHPRPRRISIIGGVFLLIARLLAWLNRGWKPTDYTAEAMEAARLKRQHEADVPIIFYWIEKEK